MQFTRCWLNGEGSVRLNKINVEFKIYWAAALQWDDILLAKKGETKKKNNETTGNHQLQAGKLY